MEVTNPTLVFSPHPMLAAAGREFHYAEFLPGESIDEYLTRHEIKLGRQPWILCVDGMPVPREWWGRVRPKPGTLITLRATVHGGGGGGGKNPLKTVLSIALMVVAPQIGSMLAQSAFTAAVMAGTMSSAAFAFATTAFTAMVSIAGNMIIGALTQPPQPKLSQVNGSYNAEQVSPTYALTGGSNRARPFEPLPLLMGEHRIFADLGAQYFTEFEGDDQYLYQIFNFGIGTTADLQLTDFKIGETPVASYDDVEIFEAGSDGKLPQMPGNVDTLAGGALTAAAGWITRTSSIDATALALDVQGQLYRAGASGLESRGCNLEAQYRLVGAETWTTWFNETLTSASRKPIRRTWRMNVTQGQYEVRARRVTADETDARNISEFSWSALRTYQPDTADYTGQRRVGLRIKASGQLQGQVEQFNAIGRRLVPVWHEDTEEWVTEFTDNPAWLYLWFARGGSISGRPAFGVGLADGRIDIDGIKAWGAWCADEGLSFNAVFDSQRSRADILDTIAQCGDASPSWATGKLGVVWDAADLPAVATFGMANIIAGSFKVIYATEKLADEVVLNFVNRDTWKQDQVRVVVPGFGDGYTPQRPVTIELFGCIDKDMAGRKANLIAASQRYHRKRIQWEADWEGLVAQRGDVVTLSHDLTQWGSSGRLVSATAGTLTLDKPVSYDAGSPYVGIRHPDGTYYIRAVAAFTGEQETLTLTTPLTFGEGESAYHCGNDPQGPALDYTYVFAPLATPGQRVKIVGVPSIRNGGERLKFEAVLDSADYYASKSNPYIWQPPVASPGGLPTVENLDIVEQLIKAGNSYAVKVIATWDVFGNAYATTVRYAFNGEALQTAPASTARRFEVVTDDAGSVEIEVSVYDSAGRRDAAAGRVSVIHAILGKAAPPADPEGFVVVQNGPVVVCKVAPCPDADFEAFEFRRAPLGGEDWDAAEIVGEASATVFSSDLVPPGAWTFLCRSRDASKNPSTGIARADLTVLNEHDIIFEAEHGLEWFGCTLTHLVRHWTGKLLIQGQSAADTQGWETFARGVPDPHADCYLEAPEVDMGFDCDARLWATWPSTSPALSLEVDWRTAAGEYGGWRSWSAGEAFGAAAKMRLHADTSLGQPIIAGFKTVADAIEYLQSAEVTIAPGGTAITFASPFHFAPLLTVFNTGGAPRIPAYTDLTATGAILHSYDLAGDSVGGASRYDAKGV